MTFLFRFLVCCFPALGLSQIQFEKVITPHDFSIGDIRKSPSGEYFLQALHGREFIYTSFNGTDWIQTNLPEDLKLEDVQFFSDGTPVMKNDNEGHLIRNNGVWYSMNFTGGFSDVHASFVKDDTLFAYQDQVFAYSLDKGLSFITLFEATESIPDHTSHLWVFPDIFVLHHTAGASDYLSFFNRAGERIRHESLNISSAAFVYNSCGQVLIADRTRYYLVYDEGHSFIFNSTESILPDYSASQSQLQSIDNHYYYRIGDTVFKSSGCTFNWTPILTDSRVASHDDMVVLPQDGIILYTSWLDYIEEKPNGASPWEEHIYDIDFARVIDVNESVQGTQVTLTPNHLFMKHVDAPQWLPSDSVVTHKARVQISPNGNIYIGREQDVLYSEDQGSTFDTLPLPDSWLDINPYDLKVLDEGVLFVTGDFIGDSYYSLNNGADWLPANISLRVQHPLVKLVDHYILIVDLDVIMTVWRINTQTQEVESDEMGNLVFLWPYATTIMDDGAIYFQVDGFTPEFPEGLYRYTFNQGGLVNVGVFPEMAQYNNGMSINNELHIFGDKQYFVYNGVDFDEFDYAGLPPSTHQQFILASNGYLYVILDQHHIYRSAGTLFSPYLAEGRLYRDEGEPCNADAMDIPLSNWVVRLQGDNVDRSRLTAADGSYFFRVPGGIYTLSAQPVNPQWESCVEQYPITVDDQQPIASQDLLAKATADCAYLTLDFSTPFLRRCFDGVYSVRVRNTGPAASENTRLTLRLDPFFDFISATIPWQMVNDSVVQFDLGVIGFQDEVQFHFQYHLSCEADLGMEHCLSGSLTDEVLCGSDRSSYTECQINIGAFDPNDKRIFNSAGTETTAVDKGEFIYYHIRFQNTGTDTAFTVRIVDPLSPMLDPGTLEMLSASHPYTFSLSDGPALVVTFNDIRLVDSTANEPASHGYVKFRIKPLPGFEYGTSIPNQASIFFDFNEPVLTNVPTVTLLPPTRVQDPEHRIRFDVYPSPAKDVVFIHLDPHDASLVESYLVLNELGQIMCHARWITHAGIDIAGWPQGVYTMVLRSEKQVIGVRKFVKI